MKLNNKRTVLVGLAFLSISAFWQMYDSIVPLVLKTTFHMDESFAGAIMAADNVLALFLLPFFGGLSDKTNTKLGRRTPFILAGTAAAVILMNLLPVLDNSFMIIMIAIAVYLVGMIAIGIAYSKQNKRSDDFYLGGRKLGPFVTAMASISCMFMPASRSA